MTCATCSKQLREETIATTTRDVGEHVVVVKSRRALVCDCGVVAWDPPVRNPSHPLARPALPTIYPQPIRPIVYPFQPTSLPYAGSPLPSQRPQTLC